MTLSASARAAAWKAFIIDNTPQERLWLKAVREFFREQRDDVLANLIEAMPGKSLNTQVKASVDDIVFDYDEEVEKFREIADVRMKENIRAAGNATAERFRLGIDFDVENPRVRAYVRRFAAQLAKGINDTVRRQVRRELAEGLKEGENVRDLSKRVADVYQRVLDFNSERIARTETIRASNFGALESYQQAGAEKKEWMAELDERVRDTHREADGQVKAVDEPFDVGGEELMFPGDPDGSPEETINCRCTVLPVT
jgi:SPP1 gp7 family putative phage head morphogenesis protein